MTRSADEEHRGLGRSALVCRDAEAWATLVEV